MCVCARFVHSSVTLRNDFVRRRVAVRGKMSDMLDRKVLKWFEHAELMSGERLSIKSHEPEVEERRDRGRPCTRLAE